MILYLPVPNGTELKVQILNGKSCAVFPRGRTLFASVPPTQPGYSIVEVNIPDFLVAQQADPNCYTISCMGSYGVPFCEAILLPACPME